jgi:hypothetical protein
MNFKIKSRKESLVQSWKSRAYLSILFDLLRLGFVFLTGKPAMPIKQQAGTDEQVWASGNHGERKVLDHLSYLSDEWTLVSGYRNSKGEIDQILVGPKGLFAFEVKYVNGVVNADGDRWWIDKYDKYGNLVESNKSLTDKGGRAPSRQLNDSVNQLQAFLLKRIGIDTIIRTVVLSHQSSKLGTIRNMTVDAIVTMDTFDVNSLLLKSNDLLDKIAIEKVLDLIKKDHKYFNRN